MRNYIGLFSILLLLLFFGCTTPAPVCNDSLCDEGETFSCPVDCDITDEATLRTVWKTATPVAIINWSFRGNYLDLVLKNNSPDVVNIDSVSINGYIEPVNSEIEPNEDIYVRVAFRISCLSNEKVIVDKPSIVIRYSKEGLFSQEQVGIAKLIGTCENESVLNNLISERSISIRGIDGQNYKLNFIGANFSPSGEVLSEWSLSKESGEIVTSQILSRQSSYLTDNLDVVFDQRIFIEKLGFSGDFGDPFVLYKVE